MARFDMMGGSQKPAKGRSKTGMRQALTQTPVLRVKRGVSVDPLYNRAGDDGGSGAFVERKLRKTSRINSGTSGGALKGNFTGDSGATPKWQDKSLPRNFGKGKLDTRDGPDLVGMKGATGVSKKAGRTNGVSGLDAGFTKGKAATPSSGVHGKVPKTGMNKAHNALEGSNSTPMAKRILGQSDAFKQSQVTFSDIPQPPKATGVPTNRKAPGKARDWHKELGFG